MSAGKGQRRAKSALGATSRPLAQMQFQLGLEGGNSEARVDLPTDRIADHTARPAIKNDRHIDEARLHRHVGDIGHPELIRAGWNRTRC